MSSVALGEESSLSGLGFEPRNTSIGSAIRVEAIGCVVGRDSVRIWQLGFGGEEGMWVHHPRRTTVDFGFGGKLDVCLMRGELKGIRE